MSECKGEAGGQMGKGRADQDDCTPVGSKQKSGERERIADGGQNVWVLCSVPSLGLYWQLLLKPGRAVPSAVGVSRHRRR